MSTPTSTAPPPVSGTALPVTPMTARPVDPNRPLRVASVVAGSGLALLTILAVFGNFLVLKRLIAPGDPATTMTNIAESTGLFRWGIASLLAAAVLDVVIAAALLRLFTPVNRDISRLAAWFRLTYAAVFLVAISQLTGVLPAIDNPEQAQRSIDSFNAIWNAGLILFGIHLLLIGYLAYRSGFIAKIIGILLVIAGLGYLIDRFGTVLVSGYALGVAQVTFVGEAVLIFWLLIRGRRLTLNRVATTTVRSPSTPNS
jgi:Domain of unknown function (DUF4386)